MTNHTTSTKICTKCGKEYPATLEFFYRNGHKSSPTLLRSWCKSCEKLGGSQAKKANRPHYREYARQWKKAHPDKVREYTRRYSQRNNKRSWLWKQANPERARENARRWKQANRDKLRLYDKRRRALKRSGNMPTWTIKDIRHIFAEQSGQCFYCHCALCEAFHLEHKTPLSRGGSNSLVNIVLACPSCNLRKGSKTAAEFMAVLSEI